MSHTESMGAIFSAYLRDNEYLGSMQSCHHPSLVLELSPFRTSWWTSHPSRTPISPTPGHLAHMASPSLGCQQEGYRPLFTVETRLPFMFKVKAQCWARHVMPCRAGSCLSPLPPHYTHGTLQGPHPQVPESLHVSFHWPDSPCPSLPSKLLYTYLRSLWWVSSISALHEYPGWSWLLSLLSPRSTLSMCFCDNVSSDFFESLFLCLTFLWGQDKSWLMMEPQCLIAHSKCSVNGSQRRKMKESIHRMLTFFLGLGLCHRLKR